MLYILEVELQIDAFPLIAAGWAGGVFTVTANVLATDEPQALLAVTLTLPEVVAARAVIVVVAEVPDQPEGKLQLYEVAPETAAMLYKFEEALQILILPVIDAG